ncbi:sugar transporter [Lonepinella koalarum]|uniref:DHA1 family L-arabinose/isopropyl-beta-D-thiogalactopyranoside export protein-like MFS transporter n=1 Tax=Lonepinella koalarum TaxID=53417 RepID=A0A4R1KYK9_9PAST|nr:sugar transporter [Lonepinella koalarum]MDH2926745.1 sugar transporter [Lonepinella koalarum]TCK70595.1 DHA1 family L-arabinose/isopropyl-beta-D-thiogalactopyranoside export protein-like MFS transporter [Lonepinella koalarum]TFJ90024.1 sugar transporter [Lonepinella koalarum]
MLEAKKIDRIGYFRVVAMAFAAFVFNTTEFVPVALLSDIASSFTMDVAKTGLMITVYAWIVSLASLPLMLATAKLERRSLLLKVFILFVASHLLSVLAWNYWVLLLARMGIAFAHAIFWSISVAMAMRVAPKGKQTQALGMIAMGSAMAMVLGLPIGRIIGQWLGWRATFAVLGVVAFTIMLILANLLPRLPSRNAGSLSSLPLLAKRPLLIATYIVVMLIVTAHFTAYSYIEPFVINISQLSENIATAILLVFGVAGLVASLLFSRLYRFFPIGFIITALIIVISSLFAFYIVSDYVTLLFIQVFIWGIGISAVSLGLQMRVLNFAPDATDVATAIFSGIYNIGIGAGALVGNQVMQHWGLANIGFVGTAVGGVAVLIFVLSWLKYRAIN